MHMMLIEDEILLCGTVLVLGIMAGAVARFIRVMTSRRPGDLR